MALSQDEQRMLAEIERRLSAEDPRLASRLSSFRRPGPGVAFRTPRGKLIGSLLGIALVAVVSMMVYAMVPFHAHGPKTTYSPQASTSASTHYAPPAATANSSATAGTGAAETAKTAKTSASGAAKTTAAQPVSHSVSAKAPSARATNPAPATAG